MSDIKDLTRLDVIIPTSTYNRLVAITKKQNASLPNNVGRLLDEGIDQMYKSHPNLKTKPTALDWSKAIAETPEPVPMEAEIWAAGADLDTAKFVARMLNAQGYKLIQINESETH